MPGDMGAEQNGGPVWVGRLLPQVPFGMIERGSMFCQRVAICCQNFTVRGDAGATFVAAVADIVQQWVYVALISGLAWL